MLRLRSVVNNVTRTLACDIRVADMSAIVAQTRELTNAQRAKFVHTLAAVLIESAAKKNERDRLGIVKVLVCLVPESKSVLLQWLAPEPPGRKFEVQFTVFLFLCRLREVEGAEAFAEEIPKLVGHYLRNVRTETASAAWMAGDLLGDHWDLRSSLNPLLSIARSGRYVAGREGALQGLAEAAGRCGATNRRRIFSVLREVASRDRSSSVRMVAQVVLDDLRSGIFQR